MRAEYTGIGVEVKFAAGTKVHKMRELSGGQQVRPLAWDLPPTLPFDIFRPPYSFFLPFAPLMCLPAWPVMSPSTWEVVHPP